MNRIFSSIIIISLLLYMIFGVFLFGSDSKYIYVFNIIKNISIIFIFLTIFSIVIKIFLKSKIEILTSSVESKENHGLVMIAKAGNIEASIPHYIAEKISMNDQLTMVGLYGNKKIDVYSLYNHNSKQKINSSLAVYAIAFILCVFGLYLMNFDVNVVSFFTLTERVIISFVLFLITVIWFLMVIYRVNARLILFKYLSGK